MLLCSWITVNVLLYHIWHLFSPVWLSHVFFVWCFLTDATYDPKIAISSAHPRVFILQAALMVPASMMVCGATTPASTSGRRCRPCWRRASTTARVFWEVSSTLWRLTAPSATTTCWTAGRPCRQCRTPWTTAPPPRVLGSCTLSAVWPARTLWPSSVTMQTPTAGPWSTVGSCRRGPSRRKPSP